MRIWDAATGREMLVLTRQPCAVRALAVSPDGLDVLTGQDDGLLKLWPAEDWTRTPEQLDHERVERWRARWAEDHRPPAQ